MAFSRRLVNDAHARDFVVSYDVSGWDMVEKEDSTVLRHVRRRIWQGAEREIQRFEITAAELKRLGWIEASIDGRVR